MPNELLTGVGDPLLASLLRSAPAEPTNCFFEDEKTLRFLSKLAACVIAASVLAACSSGTQSSILPSAGVSGHSRSVMASVAPCNSDPTSNGWTVCYRGGSVEDGGNQLAGCIIGCNPGYPTGGGSPIGQGGAGGGCLRNGGNCVGLMPPAPGAQCDGSQLQLGSQFPVNTTDKNHEVVDGRVHSRVYFEPTRMR